MDEAIGSLSLVETGAFAVLRDSVSSRRPELGVPEGVRDVIRRRLSRLSEDCSRVLTAAAVIGQEFDLEAIEVEHALREAEEVGIISPSAGGPRRSRFAHALIRETLYEELSGPRRARMHRKAGETIERLAKNNPRLADLAYHFSRAASVGMVDKAVEYATRAAERAAIELTPGRRTWRALT